VPAAAVIPAPIAYIKIVAVKKLVVGFLVRRTWPVSVYGIACRCAPSILRVVSSTLHWVGAGCSIIYFEKIRVFKAGLRYEYISME
jgi:hypothetical protein